MRISTFVLWSSILFVSCAKNKIHANPVTPGDSLNAIGLSTDKAVYQPGQTVAFSISHFPPGSRVRYYYLHEIIKDEALSASVWNWLPPLEDFRGYMVEVYKIDGMTEKSLGSIAVDVSSDGIHFPRNGFLSSYGKLSDEYMSSVVSNLNRYHMNIVQFQDWEYKHHEPLAGTVAAPAESWKDIANRDNYRSTIRQYIRLAHGYGMKTLSYNLIYGALGDAVNDGVADAWYMYRDPQHAAKEVFPLPKPPFKSDIYFLDPASTGWQNYLALRTLDAFAVYDFDGFQVDQVGNRDKALYTYSGNPINLEASFRPFLEAMKAKMPEKKLVMNAVNQYGQEISISKSPVDFLYTEVWAPHEGYQDLAAVILDNDRWSNYQKKSVLCAYMDYNQAAQPGFFNTPGVLLTNAVIFSFGGSHLELGEHMLGKEYFPNNNLAMKEDLKQSMIAYYDFLTGYENLLRDGGAFNTLPVSCTNNKMDIASWPPQYGKVSVQGKSVHSMQVLHFINFANASSLEWRDADGTQTVPQTILSADIEVNFPGIAAKIWVASPDINFGIPQALPFTQSGNTLKFTLPSLKYWDMVVIQ